MSGGYSAAKDDSGVDDALVGVLLSSDDTLLLRFVRRFNTETPSPSSILKH